MTNLGYYTPNDLRIKYVHSPEDLRRLVLNYVSMGEQYLTGSTLNTTLAKFGIFAGGVTDEEYMATFGEFMSPQGAYIRAWGYPVDYDLPLKALGVRRDDTAHGVILSVYFKHRCTPGRVYTAFYILLAFKGRTAAVCFGKDDYLLRWVGK